jgi:hypothetical protein
MACYKGQLAWKARGWAGGEQECYPDEMVCFMSSKDESVMRETGQVGGRRNITRANRRFFYAGLRQEAIY